MRTHPGARNLSVEPLLILVLDLLVAPRLGSESRLFAEVVGALSN